MKVAIATNYWKKSEGGGVKNYLINLVDELNRRDDFEISVLFRQGEDYDNYKIEGNKLLFSIKSFFKFLLNETSIINLEFSCKDTVITSSSILIEFTIPFVSNSTLLFLLFFVLKFILNLA
jgi:hypothetical protein